MNKTSVTALVVAAIALVIGGFVRFFTETNWLVYASCAVLIGLQVISASTLAATFVPYKHSGSMGTTATSCDLYGGKLSVCGTSRTMGMRPMGNT